MNEDQRLMLLDWMRKVHQLEYAHRFESLFWGRVRYWTGISAFVISTLIAFSFRFQHTEIEFLELIRRVLQHPYFIAFASFMVAILTGFQTFFKPYEKSVTHKNTGSNYEKLRHRIEFILTSELASKEVNNRIEQVKDEWEGLDAINVQSRFFDQGKEKVKSFNKYPPELSFLPENKANDNTPSQ